MIFASGFGTSPYNRGRPVLHFGGITPTGMPTYNTTSLTSTTGIDYQLSRSTRNEFYASATGNVEVFNNSGLINELLIVNEGGIAGRIYINEQASWASAGAGGFPLASGESVQLRKPISHIGIITTGGSITFNGIREYNYNTI